MFTKFRNSVLWNKCVYSTYSMVVCSMELGTAQDWVFWKTSGNFVLEAFWLSYTTLLLLKSVHKVWHPTQSSYPSVSHMFCSKALLVNVICLKLHWHLEFFLRFRAQKVLIILICPIKQLVVCGWMAACYIPGQCSVDVGTQWSLLFVINLAQLQKRNEV